MCVCVCMHICMCMYVCACVHVSVCMYVVMYGCMCVCGWTRESPSKQAEMMRTCMRICVCMYICGIYAYVWVYVCVWMYQRESVETSGDDAYVEVAFRGC